MMRRTILWLLDQTHIVVTALTAGTLLLTRSNHVAYFIIGAIGINTFAKISKNVIRQDRPNVTISPSDDPSIINSSLPSPRASPSPDPRTPKRKVKKTYGMPSTHSTSIAYYMTYLTMVLLHPPLSLFHILLVLAVNVWGGSIMVSRVILGYHTPQQVIAGGIIGATGGLVWKLIWDEFVRDGATGVWGMDEKVIGQAIRWGFGLVGL